MRRSGILHGHQRRNDGPGMERTQVGTLDHHANRDKLNSTVSRCGQCTRNALRLEGRGRRRRTAIGEELANNSWSATRRRHHRRHRQHARPRSCVETIGLCYAVGSCRQRRQKRAARRAQLLRRQRSRLRSARRLHPRAARGGTSTTDPPAPATAFTIASPSPRTCRGPRRRDEALEQRGASSPGTPGRTSSSTASVALAVDSGGDPDRAAGRGAAQGVLD